MPPSTNDAPLSAPRRLLATLGRFIRTEAAGGVVLLAAAALALAWANSPWHASYERLWHAEIAVSFGGMDLAHSLHFTINEGLMTVFFLVVGLEIRHELHDGSLAAWRLASLPLAAALGGILVPAGIYLALASQPSVRPGWAVPMATDIAFALGVLVLLGRRVPPALRSLLLALAVVDDIAAILVIAVFYSSGIATAGLLVAAGGMLGVALFQWLGVRTALPYVLPGAVVWFGLLDAGIHPTIAGVILGLVTPVATVFGGTRAAGDPERPSGRLRRWLRGTLSGTDRSSSDAVLAQPPVLRVRSALHPWVAFGIMPLFALANAGVRVDQLELTGAAPSLLAGVIAGLVIGKPLGIVLGSALAVKAGVCVLPEGVGWRHLALMGCLGGIGFTMSIFIAMLAFADDALLATARFAVLLASTLAALAGLLIGWLAGRRATV